MNQVSQYAPLLAAVFGLLAMSVRKAQPQGHFFHTTFGVALLSLGAGLLNAGAQWFASGHLTQASLVALVAGAVAGLAGAMDPTGKTGQPTFTAVPGGKDNAQN